MAVVRRKSHAYAYKSFRRKDGKVTSRYIRALHPLELRMIENRRGEADFHRDWRQEKRARINRLIESLDDLLARAFDVARLELERAGYHQHKRGEWRKRRHA